MKDGQAGSLATPGKRSDSEPDDRAGQQSSGAIYDDIDRRVQPLLTGLVPASVRESCAAQVAAAWLPGQKTGSKRRPVPSSRRH